MNTGDKPQPDETARTGACHPYGAGRDAQVADCLHNAHTTLEQMLTAQNVLSRRIFYENTRGWISAALLLVEGVQ